MKNELSALVSLCLSLLVCPVLRGAERNLVYNPGFEECLRVDLPAEYKDMINNGVSLPSGGRALMPAGWWLNPSHGWVAAGKKGGAKFEYVEGKDAHAGRRAVKITAPEEFVALNVGGLETPCLTGGFPWAARIAILEAVEPEDAALELRKSHGLSFYAKGKGVVLVMAYAYRQTGAYDQALGAAVVVKPGPFAVTAGSQWQQCRGTLAVTNADVAYILLVLCVKGELWLDDVCLEGPGG